MGWRARCSECSFWIKYILFLINFLIWITGVLFIIIGTWARLQKVKIGSLDHLATDPAFFLLTLGSIMFVISMPGCMGSLRENVLLLKLFCLAIAIVFVIEIVGGIIIFVMVEKVEDDLIGFMRKAIQTYQEDTDLKNALDYIQKTWQCCGASNYNDWEVNIYYNCSSPAQSQCGVPISCCKVRTNIQCGFQTRDHRGLYAGHSIYTTGCIEALMEIFKNNLVIVGIIAFTLGFTELFSILLAHLFIKHILLMRKRPSGELARLHNSLHQVYDSTSAPSLSSCSDRDLERDFERDCDQDSLTP